MPTGPTAPIRFEKSIVRVPDVITADTLYAVRVGAGFDLYISDLTGSITYKANSGIPGYTGSAGYVGSAGTAGAAGYVGSAGAAGYVGSAGLLASVGLYSSSLNSASSTITNITSLNFDTDAGFSLTNLGGGAALVGMNSTFKFITVDGQQQLVAQGLDTLRFVAGTGISITTDPVNSPQSLTINATSGGNSLIKTFNIIGSFGLLTGTARFVPNSQDTIKTVILTVGNVIYQDLMVGLYRNGQFVQFFTISAGNYTQKYTGLNISIFPSEWYTVNVVAGSGVNLSMALFNA